MNPLIYVAAALSMSAAAVTVYAVLSAPEGFEDKRGFHNIKSRRAQKQSTASADDSGAAGARPYLTAP